MKKLKLTVRREGSILPRVFTADITEQQLEAIKLVIDDEKLAFNILEDKRIDGLIREHYPNTARILGL